MSSAPDVEPLISMAQVAERLGMPLETMRVWRKHGRGPKGYRLGRHVQFRWSEVEAWLQTQREDDPTRVDLGPTSLVGRKRRTA